MHKKDKAGFFVKHKSFLGSKTKSSMLFLEWQKRWKFQETKKQTKISK